jgi:integrase
MSGTIHKHVAKDGTTSWRVRIDIVDEVGQRHQPQRTYPTKREAERGLREWLAEIDAGARVFGERRTVAEYMTWWLDNCAQHRVKPSTLASYRSLTTTYIVSHLGRLRLTQVTPQRVQGFYGALLSGQSSVVSAQHKPLSPRTVRYLHSILHGALEDALKMGLVARNVTEATTPPRRQHAQVAAWTPDELRRFLAVAKSDPYWPLWLIAAHTGLRQSELFGLRWRDLDLDRALLTINQSLVRVGSRTQIQGGAKRGGHTLALDAPSVAALRAHRTQQIENRLQAGPLWTDTDLVFTPVLGGQLHPSTVGRHFRRLVKEAGCSPLTFHGLRHTHATILMLNGVHPKVVSERLGHADIGITLRIYSHVLPQMHEAAAEAFAAAVAQQP